MVGLKMIVPLAIAGTFIVALVLLLNTPYCTRVSSSPVGDIDTCPPDSQSSDNSDG